MTRNLRDSNLSLGIVSLSLDDSDRVTGYPEIIPGQKSASGSSVRAGSKKQRYLGSRPVDTADLNNRQAYGRGLGPSQITAKAVEEAGSFFHHSLPSS